MKKVVIILDGKSEGKNVFDETIKVSGYWRWNVNPLNVLTYLSHKLKWDKQKNRKFRDAITEFLEFANRSFNFEELYVAEMIEKLEEADKATVVVLHCVSEDIKKKLATKDNCYSIFISDTDEKQENYHVTLNCNSETFVDDIKKTMQIMTKEEGEE